MSLFDALGATVTNTFRTLLGKKTLGEERADRAAEDLKRQAAYQMRKAENMRRQKTERNKRTSERAGAYSAQRRMRARRAPRGGTLLTGHNNTIGGGKSLIGG